MSNVTLEDGQGTTTVLSPLVTADYTTSLEIDKLAAAIAKAQPEIKGAVKDSSNPFFKSRYADLESVWAAVRKPLGDNGLAVVQLPVGNGTTLVTLLIHSSGQFIQSKLTLHPKDNTPQGVGSAISYARRYALAAVTGVYQTDDDGNEASGKRNEYNQESDVNHEPAEGTNEPRPNEKRKYVKKSKPAEPQQEQESPETEQSSGEPPATKEERTEYATKLRSFNLDSAKLKAFITKRTKVQNLNTLTKAQFLGIIDELDKALAANGTTGVQELIQ